MRHLLIACAALLAALRPAWAETVPYPIEFMAHGAIYGPGAERLTPSLDLLASATEMNMAEASALASPSQRAQADAMGQQLVRVMRGDAQGQIYGRALLVGWLLRELGAAAPASLTTRNLIVLGQLRWKLGPVASGARGQLAQPGYAPTDYQTSLLVQMGLTQPGPAARDATTSAAVTPGEQYRIDCAAAKVPIPRDWGEAGSWQSMGTIVSPFIVTGLTAELFIGKPRANDPEGVCLALPRYNAALPPADRKAGLLGIICMGKGTTKDAAGEDRSNACFWDWQDENNPIPVQDVVTKISDFWSAPEFTDSIGGVCSDCHAGENSYVVHPKEQAFINAIAVTSLDSTAWYFPKVKGGWPTNPFPVLLEAKLAALPMVAGTDKKCTTCHRLPEISVGLKAYCSDILWVSMLGRTVVGTDGNPKATGKTMPTAGDLAKYFKHQDALVAECKKIKAKLPPP
jgi:hypothetical protein